MFKAVVHPGTVLGGELKELGISAATFAGLLGVPANRISEIIRGKRAITGDTALRIAHWFGMDPLFWSNLQSQYDLAQADDLIGAEIQKLPTMAMMFPDEEDEAAEADPWPGMRRDMATETNVLQVAENSAKPEAYRKKKPGTDKRKK